MSDGEEARVLLAGDSQGAIEAALPFARKAAEYFGARLDVRLADPSSHELGIAVEAPEWLTALGESDVVAAEAVAVRDVPEAVEQYTRAHTPRLALATANAEAAATPYFRNLVAAPPCPLIVLAGAAEPFVAMRVLVATNRFGPISEDATNLTYALADGGAGCEVTFLRMVPPDMTDETLYDIQSELGRRVKERASEMAFEVEVRRARSYEAGILEALDEGAFDLVMAETPRSGFIGRLSEQVLPARLLRQEVPVLLYASPTGIGARILLRAWNYVYRAVPSTEESRRGSIYADIRRRSRTDPDYYVMLSLSVLIASFGLLLDSAAVVIGAMVIAPLMQPIIGLGLGIAMANGRLTRISLMTAAKGTVVALLLAWVVGLLLKGDGITGQLDARGQPGVLDLLVALASGAAGAYASCRKGVAESVAGVAIAVALVPPVSTAGIGVALREWPLAAGATLLFVTNYVAIATASSLMFLWMGFKPEPGRFGSGTPLLRGVGSLAVLVGIVAFSLVAWTRAGDARFEQTVRDAVVSAVESIEPEAEVLGVEVRNRDADVLLVIARVATLEEEVIAENELAIQSQVSERLHRPVTLVARVVSEPPE